VEESLSLKTVHLAEGFEAISVFTNDDLSEEVLQILAAMQVKFIATRSAGFDHINICKAEVLEISVANVPEYSPYSIAEHAIALLLALNRKIVRADQNVKDHNFSLDDLIGFDLHGKTIGIIGLGKIGGIVAKILHGFGCRILAFDLYPNQDYIDQYGMEYVSLDQLYQQSDIISIHCPLNNATRHMINEEAIKKMKKGVMLINTGRGAVVDTEALIKGLKEEKIGFAGLDVYENEKGLFFFNHENKILQDDTFARLTTFQNVLITGHQAFLTKEALGSIAETTIENLECFAKGVRPKSELTKKSLALS
jgi:D-lactate dehydrogenase